MYIIPIIKYAKAQTLKWNDIIKINWRYTVIVANTFNPHETQAMLVMHFTETS